MYTITVSDPEDEIVWTEGPLTEADLYNRITSIATNSPGRYDVAIRNYEEDKKLYTTYGIVIQNTEDWTGWVEGPFTYQGAEQRQEELAEAYPDQFKIHIRDYRQLMREGSV